MKWNGRDAMYAPFMFRRTRTTLSNFYEPLFLWFLLLKQMQGRKEGRLLTTSAMATLIFEPFVSQKTHADGVCQSCWLEIHVKQLSKGRKVANFHHPIPTRTRIHTPTHCPTRTHVWMSWMRKPPCNNKSAIVSSSTNLFTKKFSTTSTSLCPTSFISIFISQFL